jgi:hypothetical protein
MIVNCMEMIILLISANFVAVLLVGFVGKMNYYG